MATFIGSVEPYIPGNCFSDYAERMQYIFNYNNVPEAHRKSLFITVSGAAVFTELKKLYPGTDLDTLQYNDIIARLKSRFDKKDGKMVQKSLFYERCQKKDEPAEDFILDVKLLAENCGFGVMKDAIIRDRLVFGAYDPKVRERLIEEEEPTLAETERILITREQLEKQKQRREQSSERVSAIERLGPRRSRRDDYNGRNRWREAYPRAQRRDDRGYYRSRSRSASRTDWRNVLCSYCKLRGHVRKNCIKLQRSRQSVRFVDDSLEEQPKGYDFKRNDRNKDSDEDLECMSVGIGLKVNDPVFVIASINGKSFQMEIDTGSAVTVLSEQKYLEHFNHLPLEKCNKKLSVVNGDRLNILGYISVNVSLQNIARLVCIVILQGCSKFVPLIGRDWLDVFFHGWRTKFLNHSLVNRLETNIDKDDILNELKQKFSAVFSNDFSTPISGFEADLILKRDCPVFKKAYTVPLRLKDRVIEHLNSLEKSGIITPIQASEYASPVIAIIKKDNDIRLVVDCKVSINKIILPNTYPMPLPQDIFATLAGCKVFCSLDLAGAYTQLQLSERSKRIMTINTIKGLYTYNRLPQGAASSAAIFQQVMDQVLQGIEGVSCYLDDVLIAGKDLEDCKIKLYQVLERLNNANIKVKLSKCKFFVEKLAFLGHTITGDGLLPNPEKVETIAKAEPPKNPTELKAFLGLLNFYAKFIPNLASKLSCFYNLLRKDVKFAWDTKCTEQFEECKKYLQKPQVLEYFDPKKPLIVVTDACGYGIGGVLAHEVDGQEKPICFTSFTLNDAQRKYPILHLEAMAIVSCVKKFHKYLYGQHFVIYTDHKPLLGIFGKEGKNAIFVTRLQRFVMELSIYDFDIRYRPSNKMGNADFCSRFPLPCLVPENLDKHYVNSINFTNELPIDFKLIAEETKKDIILSQVMEYSIKGWPNRVYKELMDFKAKSHDLELYSGCLLFCGRVVVPKSLQEKTLTLLHSNHAGIVKIKQLARRTVFWLGINNDIESFVKNCNTCNRTVVIPRKTTDTTWIPTSRPFSRVHADFFHFGEKVFLLIVDSYSKWIELEYMKYGTDTAKVVKKFLNVFARFGFPDVLVTDGGPPFNSSEFVSFMKRQGIVVLKSPPYHPASNGQAERSVRTVKDIFKKFLLDTRTKFHDIDDQINYFLINYRNSCLTKSGKFPAEYVLSYKPKTLLDLLNPKRQYKHFLIPLREQSQHKKELSPTLEKVVEDKFKDLIPGDKLWYRNFRLKDAERWLEATFVKRISLNVFQVVVNGHVTSAHRDQLRLNANKRVSGCTLVKTCNKRKRDNEDEEPDFLGFPEETLSDRPPEFGADDSTSQNLFSGLRRSERLKAKSRHQSQQGETETRTRRSSRVGVKRRRLNDEFTA